MSADGSCCHVCLDLRWDLYPANKDFEYRVRRFRSTSLLESVTKGCRPYRVLLEGLKALLQGYRPPAPVELDTDRPYWLYMKIRPKHPLQLITYVYYITRNETGVSATNKTFKFDSNSSPQKVYHPLPFSFATGTHSTFHR